jgi:hypothetical protein
MNPEQPKDLRSDPVWFGNSRSLSRIIDEGEIWAGEDIQASQLGKNWFFVQEDTIFGREGKGKKHSSRI